jgi:cysteine desulfurase
VGKVGVNVDDLGVDLLSVAGHKLYAPKGIGALYLRRGVTIAPVLHGASHEGGLRPGTENVLEQVGLGEACSLLGLELDDEIPRLAALRDRLLVALEAEIEGIVVHGNLKTGLPNTLSVALPGVEASPLLGRLGDEVAASAGAACHSGGEVSVSHVLAAMGIDAAIARSTIRLSVGRMTTEEEVDEGAKRIIAAARHRDV